MIDLLESKLRDTADRAREAETAIRVPRHFGGPVAPEFRAAYYAALGEATVAARAIMDHAGGDCPLCQEGGKVGKAGKAGAPSTRSAS